jgi:predicted SnoaL-like aldol condensation-catalyzing enzyme
MNKIFFIAFAGMLCICSSCNTATTTVGDTGKDSTAQKNLAAFDVVSNAFQTGDASKIDSVVADDFVDHTDKGDVKGKDSLKAMIAMMHNNFKNMKTETKNEAAGGDYVYGWMHYSGTSDGTMGMPKGPFDMTSIELVKFNNGKAVEHWAFMQPQDMMKMMPPPPPPMDPTKMKK